MDWRSRVESAKAVAKAAQETGAQVTGDAIEQHWATIQTVLRERVGPATKAAVNDDELVALAARQLHGFLPLPVRIVIRPQRLTDWCLSNRDRVMKALRSDDITYSPGDTK